MAQDPIQDAHTGENDPLSDPVDAGQDPVEPTPTEGELGQDGNEPTGESGEGVEGEVIAGTPFKNQTALVDGYKNIQRLVAQKDREMAILQKQLQAALAAIQSRTQPKVDDNAPKLPVGEDFWKAFAQDPVALMQQIAKMQSEDFFKNQIDPRLGKVEGSMTGIQKANMVQNFLSAHPEFTVEDEAQVVDILEANPHLKEMENGIEIAYNQVLADRYRADFGKKAATNAVAGAKQVAGLGGKKTSLPVQAQNKDPFDSVMDLDASEREVFKMGRK